MNNTTKGGQGRSVDDIRSDANSVAIGLVILALTGFWILFAWFFA